MLLYPSCAHTTVASTLSHTSSQIVPHWLSLQTSTLPWAEDVPVPASLTSPVAQPAEIMFMIPEAELKYEHRYDQSNLCSLSANLNQKLYI